ncbi:MAG: hypothetical protein AW10_00148 [Candidatus Accumulibacter appositus]|uniref:Uncharacterized protein n=1 Tax=Candidatus Accumulibacter appositus TaxID=1454003 RepID=A0A011QVL1_9PROT|nr:MAG: hypothetical protein AW10_00148 [Candidatus Accumulibacter appositus]
MEVGSEVAAGAEAAQARQFKATGSGNPGQPVAGDDADPGQRGVQLAINNPARLQSDIAGAGNVESGFADVAEYEGPQRSRKSRVTLEIGNGEVQRSHVIAHGNACEDDATITAVRCQGNLRAGIGIVQFQCEAGAIADQLRGPGAGNGEGDLCAIGVDQRREVDRCRRGDIQGLGTTTGDENRLNAGMEFRGKEDARLKWLAGERLAYLREFLTRSLVPAQNGVEPALPPSAQPAVD